MTLTSLSLERVEETLDWIYDEIGLKFVCLLVFKGEGFGKDTAYLEPPLSGVERGSTQAALCHDIDPRGRITHSIGIGESGAIVGSMEPLDTLTFYTRFGFTLPCLCVAVSLALLIYAAAGGSARRRRA